MEGNGHLTLWLLLSWIQGVALVVIVFLIFNAIVFPNGSIFSSTGATIGIAIVLAIVGLILLCSMITTLRRAKKEMVVSDTFHNAVVSQAFVTVISKQVHVLGSLPVTWSQHIIAVEFPDRTRVPLEVDAMQYSVIVEGDAGLLAYRQKGGKFYFVAFEVQ